MCQPLKSKWHLWKLSAGRVGETEQQAPCYHLSPDLVGFSLKSIRAFWLCVPSLSWPILGWSP